MAKSSKPDSDEATSAPTPVAPPRRAVVEAAPLSTLETAAAQADVPLSRIRRYEQVGTDVSIVDMDGVRHAVDLRVALKTELSAIFEEHGIDPGKVRSVDTAPDGYTILAYGMKAPITVKRPSR